MRTLKNINGFAPLVRLTLGLAVGILLTTNAAVAQQPDASDGPIEMSDDGAAVSAPPPRAKRSGITPPPNTPVGRKAAQKYMGPHNSPSEGERSSDREPGRQLGQDDHYLTIHFGGFISDKAYNWGNFKRENDVGDATIGLTYRIGEWQNSFDLAFRVDYQGYGLNGGGSPSKLSFLPLITFPDSSSRFPLYFGVGLGLGVFTHNVNSESALSLDYQLVAGARFFEVFQNTGFFIEAGIKNHFLILSDGQFNGTFIAAGPVFTF